MPFLTVISSTRLVTSPTWKLISPGKVNDSFTISPGQPPHTGAGPRHGTTTLNQHPTPPLALLPNQCAILHHAMDDLSSHNLIATTKRERNGSKWRLKRARCTTNGCRGKTSMFCPACIPPDSRDRAWICTKCDETHKLVVRTKIAQDAVTRVN